MLAELRCSLATGLLLLIAAAAGAQADGKQDKPPEDRTAALRDALVAEVQQQLRSAESRTVAWGAHRAAEHRLLACRNDLRAALAALVKNDPDPVHYAANTVLDALVQVDADVPVREFEPFFELSPAVVLLLAKERDTETLLHAFRDQLPGSGAWRAIGNVLVARNSPELVRDVLRARIEPWVQVHDGKPIADLPPPDWVGCSFDRDHVDWPSFPRYVFTFGRPVSGQVLADDTFPTTWVRTNSASAGKCTWSGEHTLPEARAAWLQHLLGKEHEQAVRAIDRGRTLKWRDAASYPADVRALRAAIEADWRKVVDACVAAKVITADATKDLAPQIVLDMNLLDMRNDDKVRLPDVR